MIHVGQKIKIALDQQGKKYVSAAKEIGMSEGNLQKVFKRVHIDTELLAKFSKMTGKPIGWFLDEKNTQSYTTDDSAKKFEESHVKYESKNHGISIKLKIEVEVDPSQIMHIEDIRNKIILALKR